MFLLARDFATGGDAGKRAAFDGQWYVPTLPRRFRIVTAVWGVGLVVECAAQVTCALLLPTEAYLAVGQVISWGFLASLITYSVMSTREGERYAEELYLQLGGELPDETPPVADIAAVAEPSVTAAVA